MSLIETHEADTFDTQLKCLLDRRTQLVRPQDELHTRILDAAARIKKREDQLRRTTRDLRTRVEKCTEVEGEIFECLIRSETDLSFKHYIEIQIIITNFFVSPLTVLL